MTVMRLSALMASSLMAAAQTSGGYRVAGVVLNDASGQPVAGARVTLAPVERRDLEMSAVTGDNGRFDFTGIPRGKYELAGRRRGLLPASYGQRAGRASAIVTGPGQDTGSLMLRLPPPGIISGRVTDDAGEPVAGALVELLDSRIIDGRRALTAVSSKRTDDTGEYRFAALPAGSYFLAVSGVPWYTKFTETMGDSAPRSMTHAGYGIRYYPNVGDPAAAEPLALKPGQEATANFALLPVPAISVHVHCEQDDNLTKQYTLTAAGLAGNPVEVRHGSEAGNLYNFWGVPPGRYTLRAAATDGSRTWYGANEFDAGANDADVEVTLQVAPSLHGTVVPESGETLPAQLTVRLRGESGHQTTVAMDAGGRFSIPAIQPGRYFVSLGGADEYYLKNWPAEGGRRESDTLDIPAGAAVRLSLAVAKGTGRIAGTVYRDGQPLPGALVVLYPANRATPANSDGSYEFHGLPPGEYALFAVEDGTGLEYANAAAIRPYLANARKVRASAGGADDVRLDVGK
jgi:protocatechuate 3,4-dioxygenase beta subunit